VVCEHSGRCYVCSAGDADVKLGRSVVGTKVQVELRDGCVMVMI